MKQLVITGLQLVGVEGGDSMWNSGATWVFDCSGSLVWGFDLWLYFGFDCLDLF